MVIYKIINKINGKTYIGQTTRNIEIRWNEHKSRSRKGDGKLSRAMRKYGVENFTISTIYEASNLEDLNKMEETLIYKYNTTQNGYNIRIGGENSKRSKETRLKISKAKLGKKNPHVSASNRRRAGEKRNSDSRIGNTHARKAIICINNNITYVSITQASKELNISTRSIQDILKGNYEQVKGLGFRYML